jgi:predicted transcriptional regulator
MKKRNAANFIKMKILSIPERVWRVTDFPEYPPNTVSKVLFRLCKKGIIEKLHKGTYYRGKATILGKTIPEVKDVVEKVVDKKFLGGLHAFYNLGLTTQVPASLNIVSNSQAKLPNAKIIRRNITHLEKAKEEEFWIIESLRKINHIPNCPSAIAISKIKSYIINKKISLLRVSEFVMHEPPRVRALVGAIGQELKLGKRHLNRLKRSLNPFTIYKIGINNELKYKKEWHIE